MWSPGGRQEGTLIAGLGMVVLPLVPLAGCEAWVWSGEVRWF